MSESKSSGEYSVLSPWADRDPMTLHGLAPRLSNLEGKTIGLFRNDKRGSKPTLDVLEEKLKARFPSIKFTHFQRLGNICIADTEKMPEFENWLKGVDAAVFAYGD